MVEARTCSDSNCISINKIRTLKFSTEISFVKVWKCILLFCKIIWRVCENLLSVRSRELMNQWTQAGQLGEEADRTWVYTDTPWERTPTNFQHVRNVFVMEQTWRQQLTLQLCRTGNLCSRQAGLSSSIQNFLLKFEIRKVI